MSSPKNSPARIRANNRYNQKAYDRITLALPKGTKEALRAMAAARGESLNRLIGRAIQEQIAKQDCGAPKQNAQVTEQAAGITEQAAEVSRQAIETPGAPMNEAAEAPEQAAELPGGLAAAPRGNSRA